MTYHKGMRSKAMGLLTGAGMIGTGKNKQFSYPYPYPRFTRTRTRAGYPNPYSCLGPPPPCWSLLTVLAASSLSLLSGEGLFVIVVVGPH